MAYSADGSLLASGSDDTSALVWTVWPPVAAARAAALTPRGMDRLWIDLADADASRAWRAMGTLHNNPRSALALLKERLPAIAHRDEKRVAQLIADLDSDRFEMRE